MSRAAAVDDLLGGPRVQTLAPRSPLDRVDVIRRGLPSTTLVTDTLEVPEPPVDALDVVGTGSGRQPGPSRSLAKGAGNATARRIRYQRLGTASRSRTSRAFDRRLP